MKYTMVRLFLIAACSCLASGTSNTAQAGWGLLHGGSGGGGSSGGYGSYGAGYGSSGGAVAGYGSSGGAVASYGSSGGYAATSYGSSGGVAYGSSGGGSSGGGPGPLRRFAAHIHDHMAAKHARRAAYGSSGGSSGSYVSSYGSSGGYASSYGSSGGAGYGSSGYSSSYGSSGGGGYGSSGYSTSYGSTGYSTSYGSTGSTMSYGSTGSTYSSGYMGVSNQSPAAAAGFASQDSDAIYLNVDVPATAKVYVNDTPTTSTGVSRQYVSRGLEAGKNYKFELRAEVVGADGKVAKETKLVTLTAGQKETVQFASLDTVRVQTAVTLNVPADAKVILAGNETSATGETRTFRTSQLKAGDRWDDYVVEVHHNGKVKRESLRLVAGDEVALTFNFEDDKSLVASR